MSKINQVFEEGKAFIPFITVGDPDLETTEKLIYALEDAGSNLIELGIPFSDPTAEGPVIMGASERALNNKICTDDVFKLVKKVRKNTQIPLAFMTYANVVYSYGIERFAKKSEEVGIDALILPDVPFEEKSEFETVLNKHNIDLISLVAPTSKGRVEKIAKEANGFIYCVSSLGVTGERSSFSNNLDQLIKTIKTVRPNLPCAIGFGISNKVQAHEMAKISDGAIVGSAIVRIIEKHGRNCVPFVKEFAKELKLGVIQ
ncbi:MAG: tryptophan synthase subunit alpha [Pleomorphochaeta sp.]